MTCRMKLPDERPSITKRLTITYAGDGQEQLVELLQNKIARLKTEVNRPKRPGSTSKIKAVLSEPEVIRPRVEVLKVYIQVGLYPDTGLPGEIFLKADRTGTLASGMLDALSMAISVGLQSGVPLQWFTSKMRGMQFEPSGTTNDPDVKRATSIVDAVARWLDLRFSAKSEE